MDVQQLLARATDGVTVQRVFGAPVERDGALVVPVAVVRGAAGGGGGSDGQDEGSGGGTAFTARPAGVFVVRDGDATWRPAVDVNRIVLGGQVVAVVLALVVRSVLRRRR